MDEMQPMSGVPAPLPKLSGVTIRPGTMADIPFLDALQRPCTRQVGWMPTKQLEGHVAKGNVLIAEQSPESRPPEVPRPGSTPDTGLRTRDDARLGYLIAQDQYFKRDDLGIIYQVNVAPGTRRGYIGAALLKAQFERSAWGCRLYCCWCAQDIEANRFWEAMGFVPIAFRAGSEKRSRVHVFWQKRIRAGDASTPWWFPSKTSGGSLREDRIVLPIPPGRGWEEDLPRIYPELPRAPEEPKALPEPAVKKPRTSKVKAAAEPPAPVRRAGLLGNIPQPGEALPETKPAPRKAAKPKAENAPRPKRVCDPRLASAARELRDRWLERADTTPLLPAGKYDVTRGIERDARRVEAIDAVRLLDAA